MNSGHSPDAIRVGRGFAPTYLAEDEDRSASGRHT